MTKINDKWAEQWVVPSSSGDGEYIVSKDRDGNYACGCRGWTGHYPRTDCKHIREVLAGRALTLAQATIARMKGQSKGGENETEASQTNSREGD